MATQEELADLERMSNDYVPDAKGPLVGEQQSTQALVKEYAQAHPVYVHKTRALPSKFSHYRTIRGDGNCGWRAVAFGYFECLLRLRDPVKVRTELARLQACNSTLDAAGFDSYLYEDFVSVTFQLLEDIAAILPAHDGGAFLEAKFNEKDGPWTQVTYHFRMLTSAWMKLNPALFSDFLENTDVASYCSQTLEPFAVEMEHIGLQGLAFAVINAAGIAIEILYLDRSEGAEVNAIRMDVSDKGNVVEGTPTIRLLYRPGHYDLLYTTHDVSEMAIGALTNPEVRLVNDPIFETPVYKSQYNLSGCDYGAEMADLPGFSYAGPAVEHFYAATYPDQSQPSPIPSIASIPSPTTGIRTVLSHTSLGPTMEKLRAPSKSSSPPSSEKLAEDKFRSSQQQWDYDSARAIIESEQVKAGFTEENPDLSKKEDPAHYTNEAFQPQQWMPGPEYDGETSGKSS